MKTLRRWRMTRAVRRLDYADAVRLLRVMIESGGAELDGDLTAMLVARALGTSPRGSGGLMLLATQLLDGLKLDAGLLPWIIDEQTEREIEEALTGVTEP